MIGRLLLLGASLMLLLANGCATRPLPGGAGEVSGPLRGIELYAKWPERGELYPTAARERLFASDRAVYVASYWTLPGSGEHVSKVVLRTPAGTVHREREYRFRPKAPGWVTGQGVELPQGEAAQPLAGRWEVEVFLDGKSVGWRAFTFDPSSIRLRTDARLVVVQGKGEFGGHPGEWRWRNPATARERTEAAAGTFGVMFRDELARRFPIVEGPKPARRRARPRFS